MTIDVGSGSVQVHQESAEPWKVTLIDTGDATQTGGRVKQVLPYVADDEAFCLTYGDGLADVDIPASIEFHRQQGAKATVTAVQPPGRFGGMALDGGRVRDFIEKPQGDGGWINGGFFVCSPEIGDYIPGDETIWEHGPLETLAGEGELAAFEHRGFFQPMDTVRDQALLNELWESGRAPWALWR